MNAYLRLCVHNMIHCVYTLLFSILLTSPAPVYRRRFKRAYYAQTYRYAEYNNNACKHVRYLYSAYTVYRQYDLLYPHGARALILLSFIQTSNRDVFAGICGAVRVRRSAGRLRAPRLFSQKDPTCRRIRRPCITCMIFK